MKGVKQYRFGCDGQNTSVLRKGRDRGSHHPCSWMMDGGSTGQRWSRQREDGGHLLGQLGLKGSCEPEVQRRGKKRVSITAQLGIQLTEALGRKTNG